MANKRTYWAIEAIGTAIHGTGEAPATYQFVPGVQSVGMSTNFNLEFLKLSRYSWNIGHTNIDNNKK